MKFRANHDIVVGKPPGARTVVAGQILPKLPMDELQRLVDLGAVTGIEDAGDDAAEKAAAEKAAAEKAAAEKAAATPAR